MTDAKRCPRCGVTYPLTGDNWAFRVRENGATAPQGHCRNCNRDTARVWAANHRGPSENAQANIAARADRLRALASLEVGVNCRCGARLRFSCDRTGRAFEVCPRCNQPRWIPVRAGVPLPGEVSA